MNMLIILTMAATVVLMTGGPARAEHATGDRESLLGLGLDFRLGREGFTLDGRMNGPGGPLGLVLDGRLRPGGFTLDGRVKNGEQHYDLRLDAGVSASPAR